MLVVVQAGLNSYGKLEKKIKYTYSFAPVILIRKIKKYGS